MSVLFLPPSAGAASVPDATETVSGKIRIATSAEATTGTNDLTAMTPLKVKSVVDAAVVGGVTYQGTFDTSSPVDLSNAEKGDLYIISVAGSYQGQTWAVGDHLLVNEDMGGTISPSKLDKVDNTDAVTSVAGKTGAVTLVAGDVSGLAAVATSGAYSDLSGTPTLGTAAAEDVGTSASNVVQLDGSARLPAVDGSQLINLPSASVAALNDIGDVTITSPADNAVLKYDSSSSEWVDAFQVDYVYTSTTQTLAAKDGVNKVMFGSLSQTTSITLTVTISSARTILFVLNQRGATCDLVIGSDTWSLATGEGGLWIATGNNQAVRVSDLTPTLATVATSGSYDDLSDKPILRDQTSGTVTISAPSSPAIISHVNLPTAASQSVTLPASSAAIAGTQITIHNSSTTYSTDVTAQGGDVIRRGTGAGATTFTLEPRQSVTVSYIASGSAVVLFVTGFDAGLDVGTAFYNTAITTSGPTLAQIADNRRQHYTITFYSPGNPITVPTATSEAVGGVVSFYNNTTNQAVINCPGARLLSGSFVTSFTIEPDESRSFVWIGVGALEELTATRIDRLNDVSISSPSGGEALIYNGTLSVFQNATISGSVTSVAGKTGAVTLDLNDNTDVSYTPGAGIDNYVLTYDHATTSWGAEPSAGGGSAPSVTVSSPSANQTLSAPSAGVIEEAYIYTPSTAITVNLVAAATVGSGFKYQIKNRSANTITIDPNGSETVDGSATFALTIQESSVTLITDGSNWFII